jgi:hypothetical protein
MIDPISAGLSVLAVAVSATTAWLTLFRRGTVRMTQPTVVFFGPDIPRVPEGEAFPKVFLRTLLFATARRGRVIESMYVSLSRNETAQNVNVWVYGDERDRTRTLLFAHPFEISRDVAALLREPEAGVYFDWGPDSSRYLPHVEKRLRSRPNDFLEELGITSKTPGELDG